MNSFESGSDLSHERSRDGRYRVAGALFAAVTAMGGEPRLAPPVPTETDLMGQDIERGPNVGPEVVEITTMPSES